MTSKQSLISYFTKLMNSVPDTEPDKEKIVKAYEEHVKKIKREEEDGW